MVPRMWCLPLLCEFLTFLVLLGRGDAVVEQLGKLNVNPGKITISGFSSGGTMAMQMSVAYSKNIGGVAAFNSIWYRCAPSNELHYRIVCSNNKYSVENGIKDAQTYETQNLIDPLANLADNKVFLWIGKKDEMATWETRAAAVTFYERMGVKTENIAMQLNEYATHFMPTVNASHPTCKKAHAIEALFNNKLSGVAYCEYDGAFEGLLFILNQKITRPNRSEQIGLEPLREFDQSEFLAPEDQKYLDTKGYLYIPSMCKYSWTTCPFHVSLHGCAGSTSRVGDRYVRESGYLEVAETNGIIMLFPQSINFLGNEKGCWEVWKMIGDNFANKNGTQLKALGRMIEKATGRSLF